MALYNEILVGRYNRMLEKLFSMKGPPPAPQLSSEVQPVFSFQNSVDSFYLEGWEKFVIEVQVAALAANPSIARVRNPAGSNVVAVIEHILLENQQAAVINTDVATGALAADLTLVSTSNARMDARSRPQPSLLISRGNVGTALAIKWRVSQVANSMFHLLVHREMQFPLMPGDAIDVVTETQNIVLDVSIGWRERSLEASELT